MYSETVYPAQSRKHLVFKFVCLLNLFYWWVSEYPNVWIWLSVTREVLASIVSPTRVSLRELKSSSYF